jgi:hypothetical protein
MPSKDLGHNNPTGVLSTWTALEVLSPQYYKHRKYPGNRVLFNLT